MNPDPNSGGWAPGNLTPEERKRLAEAALRDQSLFNELAEEDRLRELLEDPAVRADALRALENRPWFARPLVWTAASALAAGAILVAILIRPPQPSTPEAKVEIAEARRPEPPPQSHASVPPPAAARRAKADPAVADAKRPALPPPEAASPVSPSEPKPVPQNEPLAAAPPPARIAEAEIEAKKEAASEEAAANRLDVRQKTARAEATATGAVKSFRTADLSAAKSAAPLPAVSFQLRHPDGSLSPFQSGSDVTVGDVVLLRIQAPGSFTLESLTPPAPSETRTVKTGESATFEIRADAPGPRHYRLLNTDIRFRVVDKNP